MPYLAILEYDGRAYGGFFPELHVTAGGKSFDEMKRLLAEGAALYLHELAALGQAVPPARLRSLADVPAADLENFGEVETALIEPAPINPLSVLIERAIHEARESDPSLSDTELARRMDTSRASLSRLRDFFYWDHGAVSLRKLERVLGIHFTYGYQRAG